MVDIELQESQHQDKDNRDSGISNSKKQSDKDNSKNTATAETPPAPPLRDYATETEKRRTEVAGSSGVYASVEKRKTLGSFPPRPEFVYRPENTEAWMSCLRIGLIVFNLFIWVGDVVCCCCFCLMVWGVPVWDKTRKYANDRRDGDV